MKKNFTLLVFAAMVICSNAQSLDFKTTIYYTAAANTLTSSGTSLTGFDFSSAASTHPIFNGGIYFPVVDFQGNNIWVRVKHIAADPNGTSVGVNVPATCGDPFRAGFGGWAGFLYEFEIYQDANLTGAPSNMLNGLYPSNISVESIETLSAGEWVSFELLNAESSSWVLNSTSFTGSNPGSNPGFSAVNIPWPGSQPPVGFSTTFPVASKNIYVVDYGGNSYAEFRMSADNVSRFYYGYEYTGLCGGYQGMNMSFGIKSTAPLKLLSFKGENSKNINLLQWQTANEINTAYFLVEQSGNGKDFNNIGKVAARNTAGNHSYGFTDASPVFQLNYYRLKQVDRDGRFTYSPVIKLSNPLTNGIIMYPNPVKRGENLQLNFGDITIHKIEIINALGQVVYVNTALQTGTIVIPVSASLPGGQYHVKVVTGTKVESKKIWLQ